jgi:NADPH:quinone reductase-like Zn-dependent oxidoreductase
MKAIRYQRYGGPDVLELRDVDPPAVGVDEVLIRVRAAAVNPLDFHFMRGTPYLVRAIAGLSRPKVHGLGADVAGQVEAVGRNVTRFQPGDEVFGECRGAFAEQVCVRQDAAVLAKPANLSFAQAAAVPVAGFTALQALRDTGGLQPGYRVLVNGASGGVGTFAVQLAKAFGAEVTGVCSTRNVETARSIGADHVIDYTKADFTRNGQRYDLVIDTAGNRTLPEIRRVLTPKGVLVGVGAPDRGDWIAPLLGMARMVLYSAVVSQRMRSMLARPRRDDLAVLRELIEAGKVTPVIDRTYPLAEVPAAIRYLEEGHARGKVVITVGRE